MLLFSRLGCPGSTPGKGILFPGCLLLFNGLGCPGSAHGGTIHLPGCINAKGGHNSQKGTNFMHITLLVSNVANNRVQGSAFRILSFLVMDSR
jgi:hypothetical protein